VGRQLTNLAVTTAGDYVHPSSSSRKLALNAPKDEWLQKAGDGWVGAERMRDFVALMSTSRPEVTIHLAGAAVLRVWNEGGRLP
jgi:hypothetical protein